jgi:hypothetical protein
MKPLLALLCAAVLVFAPLAQAEAGKPQAEKPNVVLIVADDLGLPDLST